MSKWKMVPSFLTPEMWAAGARTKGLEASYEAMLAAAPKWGPSEADCNRLFNALGITFNGDKKQMRDCMRAALKAAVGGG